MKSNGWTRTRKSKREERVCYQTSKYQISNDKKSKKTKKLKIKIKKGLRNRIGAFFSDPIGAARPASTYDQISDREQIHFKHFAMMFWWGKSYIYLKRESRWSRIVILFQAHLYMKKALEREKRKKEKGSKALYGTTDGYLKRSFSVLSICQRCASYNVWC